MCLVELFKVIAVLSPSMLLDVELHIWQTRSSLRSRCSTRETDARMSNKGLEALTGNIPVEGVEETALFYMSFDIKSAYNFLTVNYETWVRSPQNTAQL